MSKLDFSVDKIETTDNKKDSIDNLQDTQSYTSLKGLRDLFKYIYPVNSIYISYSHTYPGDLFGGTWERIEGVFLWCGDEFCNIGARGGEAAHTLTVNEMPSHSHYQKRHWGSPGSENRAYVAAAELTEVHEYGSQIDSTHLSGGDQPHNNMPPYIQVSAWRRTEL